MGEHGRVWATLFTPGFSHVEGQGPRALFFLMKEGTFNISECFKGAQRPRLGQQQLSVVFSQQSLHC